MLLDKHQETVTFSAAGASITVQESTMSSIYPSIICNTACGRVTHPKRIPQSYRYNYHVILGLTILHGGNFLDAINSRLKDDRKALYQYHPASRTTIEVRY